MTLEFTGVELNVVGWMCTYDDKAASHVSKCIYVPP